MVHEIITINNDINNFLKTPILESNPAAAIVEKALDDMVDTMRANNGIGLAANQIGINFRLAVVEFPRARIFRLINPRIMSYSQDKTKMFEACLSIPGEEVEVERSNSIWVLNNGETVEYKGIIARAVQHEVDHLNGILITDYKLSLPL